MITSNTWAYLSPDLRLAAEVIDYIKGRYPLLEDNINGATPDEDLKREMCSRLVCAVTAEVLDILKERSDAK